MTTAAPEGQAPPSRTEVLLRQIESKINLEGENTSDKAAVPFGKLISLATGAEKAQLYLGWFAAFIAGACIPVLFFFLGPVFDSFNTMTDATEIRDKIRELCGIMGIVSLCVFIFGFIQNFFLTKASATVAARMRGMYLKQVLGMESSWYDQVGYTEMASKLTKECDMIQRAIGLKQGNIIYSYGMCIAGLVVGFYKGWSLALVMLGIAPLMFTGMGVFTAVMASRSAVTMRAYCQSAGYAEQALNAIRIVTSFGQEGLEIKNYNRFLERVTVATHKAGCATGSSMGFFFFSIYICYAYAFAMGGIWVEKPYWNYSEDRDYLAGDCISVFFGILFGLFGLGGAGPAMNAVNEGCVAGKAAFDVLDRVPVIQQDEPNTKMHKLEGNIEFKNVSFYYPSRPDQTIMNEFSYTFEVGKTTAIVGPSGSGKSTTVQLTERFYDPTGGEILVDGVPLKSINLRNYRQQIGYVGQEPALFNTTIKKNILMGKPDATDAEIEDALKKTNSWDFVSKYPKGMNESCGQGGNKLSGGQKQRIALARAFIKKPRVLIFDEATSALDKRNEAEVQKAIDDMKSQLGAVTTLVIAHRLSTIKQSDTIVVMKKGRIVEKGTHDSLLQDFPTGIYSKLVSETEKQEAKEKAKEAEKNDGPTDEEVQAQLAALNPALLLGAKKQADGKRQSVLALKEAKKAEEGQKVALGAVA